MTEEGYEVMGPAGGGAGTPAAANNPAIPAFPVSSGGSEKPAPASGSGGIPQFPVASHGSGAAPPPPPTPSGTENKEAGFVDDQESNMGSAVAQPKGASRMKGTDGKKKNKSTGKSEMDDVDGSRMENASSGAPPGTNRPNTLDTCQLSIVIFFIVLVVAISIPVLLTATGSADIEYVKKNLQKL